MYLKFIIGFLISHLILFIQAIDLKPIRLPSVVTEKSSIYLECKFNLEGFNLDAVKWRKNRALFYKYQPDDPYGIKRSYPIQGVNVNLKYSNETHVFLENVDFDTQGIYSCDVISKNPFQKEVSSEDKLTVVHSDFLFTPLGSTGPRLQNQKQVNFDKPDSIVHSDIHIGNQGSAIISPETQKERTVTTILKKSSTLLSENSRGSALHPTELENVRARLSNTIDLSKLKNLNYNQHHDYINRDGSRLRFDQTSSKQVKTIDTGYFPVELGPKVIQTELPGEQQVTTIKKTFFSPKQYHDIENNIVNQKIEFDANHIYQNAPHNTHGSQKTSRYEIEGDGIAFNNPNYHHRSVPGGVYRLSPEQYADFKFLIREPGDVILFKPFNNQSQNSHSINCKPSWIFLNMILLIILMINYNFNKY